MRLVGTTKSTIQAIRERTHWNARQPDAARSGDARPLLADRSRHRGAARLQGQAGRRLKPRARRCCRRRKPPRARKPRAAAAESEKNRRSSMSTPCSPSSSRSAAKATKKANNRGCEFSPVFSPFLRKIRCDIACDACAHAGREKLITSGIWLQHELRLSSELELFANSTLSWDLSVRREDRVTGISRPTATICSNMWL